MNTVKVRSDNEKLMQKVDKHFDLVLHIPRADKKKEYTGKFVVYDTRSKHYITNTIKQMEEEIVT